MRSDDNTGSVAGRRRAGWAAAAAAGLVATAARAPEAGGTADATVAAVEVATATPAPITGPPSPRPPATVAVSPLANGPTVAPTVASRDDPITHPLVPTPVAPTAVPDVPISLIPRPAPADPADVPAATALPSDPGTADPVGGLTTAGPARATGTLSADALVPIFAPVAHQPITFQPPVPIALNPPDFGTPANPLGPLPVADPVPVASTGPGGPVNTAVPEPTLLLPILAAAGLGRRRHRR